MVRARGLASPFRPSVSCPRHLHTPNPVLLCATSTHGADCIYLPLGCLVKESFSRVFESAGHKCQGGMMGQSYQRVWPILLWAGQPHFNSVFNLRGHKCNFVLFFSLGHLKPWWGLFNLKEHRYKHTCIIFVILFDDEEEKGEKPHRPGLDADTPTWHHS